MIRCVRPRGLVRREISGVESRDHILSAYDFDFVSDAVVIL